MILQMAHRSEEHTSELQSRQYLVCRLLLEKKEYLFWSIRPASRTFYTTAIDGPTSLLACEFDRIAGMAVAEWMNRPQPLYLFFFLNDAAPTELPLFPPPASFQP